MTLALATRLALWKDDDILRELAKELEQEGIAICESTFGLEGILAEEGTLTAQNPVRKSGKTSGTDGRWPMISAVWTSANASSSKTVSSWPSKRSKGTDEAIKRGGHLAKEGAVVVKRSKPQQDLRFDLPAVGPRTIDIMASVKASALAVEAGRTILLDRELTLEKARVARIAIVGIKSE